MYYNVCAHTHTKIPLLKNKIINKSNAIFNLKKIKLFINSFSTTKSEYQIKQIFFLKKKKTLFINQLIFKTDCFMKFHLIKLASSENPFY